MPTQLIDDDTTADVSEEHSEDAGIADEQAATPSGSGHRQRRAALAVAAGVCLVALGALTFLGWQYKQHRDVAAESGAALAAAQMYAATLTSIDATNVDDNFSKVVDGATGEFKDMYSQSATQLRQVLIDNKAMSRGVVVDAAVKSAARDKVEVLLFVD